MLNKYPVMRMRSLRGMYAQVKIPSRWWARARHSVWMRTAARVRTIEGFERLFATTPGVRVLLRFLRPWWLASVVGVLMRLVGIFAL